MTSNGLVSIIIPTHYRNKRLRAAIESALQQTHDPIEILVVDDSGERHAEKVVKEYGVSYLPHEKNMGGNPARNTGIEVASGKYIQLLDDDDILYEEKIEKQIDLLNGNPDTGVAYCGVETRRGKDLPDPSPGETDLHRALKFDWPTAITSSLLISNEVLNDVFPLETRKAADDVGMKIELAKRTNFDYVNEVLVKLGDSSSRRSRTIHLSEEMKRMLDEYDELYRQAPEEVRRGAISTMYRHRGYALLNKKLWTPDAITSMAKAHYFSNDTDLKVVGSLIASVFGRPGMRMAATLYNRYYRAMNG